MLFRSVLTLDPVCISEEFGVVLEFRLPITVVDGRFVPGENLPDRIFIRRAYLDIVAVGVRLPCLVGVEVFKPSEHLIASGVTVDKQIAVFRYIPAVAGVGDIDPAVIAFSAVKIVRQIKILLVFIRKVFRCV